MSFSNIFYILGVMTITLCGAMLLPLLVAGAASESAQIIAFAESMALLGFLGGALVLGLRDLPRRSGIREAVVLMLLGWSVLPVLGALPFFISGTSSSFVDAYFEAVSGLTTTGATVLTNLDTQPRSIILWRAILQWLGGFGSLLMAVGVFGSVGLAGLPVQRPPVKVQEGHQLLGRLRPVAEFLGTTYIYSSLFCFILIWIGGIPPFHAFCIALSTISTGGFMSRDGTLSEFGAPGAEIVIALFMIIGSLNFVLHHEAFAGRFRQYKSEPEVLWFIVIGLSLALAMFFLADSGATNSRHFFSSIFNGLSLISTTGFFIGEGSPTGGLPSAVILAAVLIGGSAMSTAGGLKLIRLIILFRHMVAELNRLAHPHSIARVSYNGRSLNTLVLGNLWIYFVLLTALVGVVSLVMAAHGFDFETSLSAAVAALSNAGPIFSLVAPGDISFADFPSSAKLCLAAAMMIGRVEILALLPIFGRTFWQT